MHPLFCKFNRLAKASTRGPYHQKDTANVPLSKTAAVFVIFRQNGASAAVPKQTWHCQMSEGLLSEKLIHCKRTEGPHPCCHKPGIAVCTEVAVAKNNTFLVWPAACLCASAEEHSFLTCLHNCYAPKQNKLRMCAPVRRGPAALGTKTERSICSRMGILQFKACVCPGRDVCTDGCTYWCVLGCCMQNELYIVYTWLMQWSM